MKIIQISGTTDALGALTVTSSETAIGYVEKIIMDYVDGDTGADLTFSLEEGGFSQQVLVITNAGTSDLIWMPRSPCNSSVDGSAFTNWADKFFVAGGNFKLVVAQGGNAKQFSFRIVVNEV